MGLCNGKDDKVKQNTAAKTPPSYDSSDEWEDYDLQGQIYNSATQNSCRVSYIKEPPPNNVTIVRYK